MCIEPNLFLPPSLPPSLPPQAYRGIECGFEERRERVRPQDVSTRVQSRQTTVNRAHDDSPGGGVGADREIRHFDVPLTYLSCLGQLLVSAPSSVQ